jgi:hypothetical protein
MPFGWLPAVTNPLFLEEVLLSFVLFIYTQFFLGRQQGEGGVN